MTVAKSFADSILDNVRVETNYMDTSFISCGSVEVESIFSVSSHVWNDRRLGTSPEHVESFMFLKVNRHLWDERLVAEAIQACKDGEEID